MFYLLFTGFVGPSCFYPCEPCFNGTCSSDPGSYGQCVCNPGFSDPACLIECGDPGTAYAFREIEDTTFGMTIGQISAGEVGLCFNSSCMGNCTDG